MDLKEGKQYIIGVEIRFDGEFKGFEDKDGVRLAVFQQAGHTDRGGIPMRKVPITNITYSELVKY